MSSIKEHLLKGKGSVPLTTLLRSGVFILKILVTFDAEQATLLRRSTVLSLSLKSVFLLACIHKKIPNLLLRHFYLSPVATAGLEHETVGYCDVCSTTLPLLLLAI
jgi:hypothetical protein